MSETIEKPAVETAAPETPGSALAVVKAALPAILAADKEDILGKLAHELAGFEGDVSTEKGRKEIASKAYKVATAKADLIRLGKTLTENARAQVKAVNAECNVLESRMDELRDHVRKPLDDFQDAERARVAAHEAALAALEALAVTEGMTAVQIGERLWSVPDLDARPWQEFAQRADKVTASVTARLQAAHEAAVAHEAAAAEAARLHAENAARIAAENEQRRIEREAEIAANARAVAVMEAEAEAERQRQATARALADAAEREKGALERAEAARIMAESRDRQIDLERQAAREQAAREQAEAVEREGARLAALAAEQQAKADEEKAEADRRAASRAHQAKINRKALAALLALPVGLTEAQGRAVLTAIVTGGIPALAIRY